MNKPDPMSNRDGDKPGKRFPRYNKRKLDRFLASICEAGGMTAKNPVHASKNGLACKGPCAGAQWRAHMDIPSGILCVSASPSNTKHGDKHWDVTITLTYMDDKGKPQRQDMVFCDHEIRWLMETFWHAPIWD